jgi:hypothetical protein
MICAFHIRISNSQLDYTGGSGQGYYIWSICIGILPLGFTGGSTVISAKGKKALMKTDDGRSALAKDRL